MSLQLLCVHCLRPVGPCSGRVASLLAGLSANRCSVCCRAARVGDTWHHYRRPVEPLPGFKPAKSMVFAGERQHF